MGKRFTGFRQQKPPDGKGGGAEGKPIRSKGLGNYPWLSTDLIKPTVFVAVSPTQPTGSGRKNPGFRGRRGD